MGAKKGGTRRYHDARLKAEVLAACAEAGASVAGVALSFGLNANLVYHWIRRVGVAPLEAPIELPMSAAATRDGFIEFQLPPPVAAAVQRPDIRVELK
ncbi:transposase, partial [Variovorax saccharolyticus]|uniref:transposase n=1 Tax=Variovorax saccharolyticus TaxID=3053516 RepID=UPI00257519AC